MNKIFLKIYRSRLCISHRIKGLCAAIWVVGLTSCSTTPPKEPDNLCSIFREKNDWYDAASASTEKWGAPIHVMMAMMYQESSFRHDAQPPMQYFLGFIPVGRASSAYGYAQAKTITWADYQKETGHSGAGRDDFDDAIDFMGWFIHKTKKLNHVSKWNAHDQYLSYHEGWGGYRRGSYRSKAWLLRVADKVQDRSIRYARQYKQCKKELDSSGFWSKLF